ncbi:MAG: hypothetical protein ACRD0O_10220 [Acidimicrobiia bacterium]
MHRTTILRLATVGLAAVGLAAVPGVAWAHASFVNGSAPANADQTLTLDVPEEKGPDAHNQKVIVEVPGGFTVAGCSTPAGWACGSQAAKGRTVVTFSRGAAPVETRFDLQVHTPAKAGEYPFQVNQFYDDGSAEHWDGPPDSETPAPVLRVG